MLEITYGKKTNEIAINQIIEKLDKLDWNGSLYIGYPLLNINNKKVIDIMITCKEHGVIIIDIPNQEYSLNDLEEIKNNQDQIYTSLEIKFKDYSSLVSRRKLKFNINVISIVPGIGSTFDEDDYFITNTENFIEIINNFDSIENLLLNKINSAIQTMESIKPNNKRLYVQKDNSRGNTLKEIEKQIAFLDKWQKQAAIEYPEGIQRIRGLAGSGKTIVLAYKAAFLHATNPNWDIAVTFHTRSLKQLFINLIQKFMYGISNDEPNWEKLKIIHTWGSESEPGIYSEIAMSNNITPQNFYYGRTKYNYQNAFKGVCSEIIQSINEENFIKLYDAVLIDEAQDLPSEFFQLVYLSTYPPHRIIYAYDELQTLNDFSMVPPEQLFGKMNNGQNRVPELRNVDKKPKQDIVLPICYRNTPWALTIAHSLGFGIYREDGLAQFFENPSLLLDVGYEVLSGSLELGKKVTIKRESYNPDFMNNLLDPLDAVIYKSFPNKSLQAKEVAEMINNNLSNEELEYSDILVIIPNPITYQSETSYLIKELNKYNISSHIVGVNSSKDKIFKDKSIAISNIYRAKGNEAAMVYILNSEYCYSGLELAKLRNILFTGITRSKAWVRIFGCGEKMDKLIQEIEKVKNNEYKLSFTVPTKAELETINKLNRERTENEKKEIKKLEKNLEDMVQLFFSGELNLEHLSPELVSDLYSYLKKELNEGE